MLKQNEALNFPPTQCFISLQQNGCPFPPSPSSHHLLTWSCCLLLFFFHCHHQRQQPGFTSGSLISCLCTCTHLPKMVAAEEKEEVVAGPGRKVMMAVEGVGNKGSGGIVFPSSQAQTGGKTMNWFAFLGWFMSAFHQETKKNQGQCLPVHEVALIATHPHLSMKYLYIACPCTTST